MKVILNVDGASRGNPGQASCGAIIKTEDGAIRELGIYLGVTTNNVAEYSGIVAGLEECLSMGATEVEVRSDSELCIRQLLGEYKVKSPKLAPLYRKVLDLSRRFRRFEARHVPREENAEADAMCNRVLDLRALLTP